MFFAALMALFSTDRTYFFCSYNQTVIDYDATKEEKVAAVKAKKAQIEERLREKP
jgi:hypothetical protein